MIPIPKVRSTTLRHGTFGVVLLAVVALAAAPLSAQLPTKLTDAEFWKMVTDFSEPPGTFRSENFSSNEAGYQRVIPELKRTTAAGGVYLGVGPEQNFTYIVALQPKLAFITDIRRQNLLQHLIYKVLMEQNDNRADFLSHLFSRPRPPGLDSNSTAEALFAGYATVSNDAALYQANLASVLAQLTKQHGFTLSDSDVTGIGHVVRAFYQAGPNINYSFIVDGYANPGGGRGGGTPNYATLMVQTDGQGVNRSYLATEANYRQLRDMELRNAIIPVVGDFGGPKALRAIGSYLKEHQATVTTMYCSNVEQYLFSNQPPGWREFYSSVATFPLDSTSTFIRTPGSGGGRGGGGFGRSGGVGGELLASMQATVNAFKAGQINSHADMLALSHPY